MILLFLGCQSPVVPSDAVPPTPPTPGPPDILIIVADDVGVDAISGLEAHPEPAFTPNIDQLAESGVRFDRTWGTPACSPARAQILTGRFGRRYGLGNIVSFNADSQPYDLPEAEQTLGELAREAGYTSIYVGKWHLTSFTRSWMDAPARHGFDRYRTTAGNLGASSTGEPGTYYRFERNDNGEVGFVDGYVTTVQTDDAIEEASTVDGPWMMVVAYNAAHAPFELPPEHLHTQLGLTEDSSEPDRFRAVVEALDTEVGRLLTALDDGALRVVFVSDNGTPLEALLPPTPLGQGKPSIKEGGLHVPLIVHGPGIQPGISDAAAQLVDILPTVAGWMSVEPAQPLDGFDLAPQLDDPGTPSSREVQYADTFRFHHRPDLELFRQVAVRDERWKYLNNGREFLYDLSETPWDVPQVETRSTVEPEVVQRYRDAVGRIHEEAPYAYR